MSTSTSRRVVITGLGLVSPVGNTVEAFWDALMSGRSGVTYLHDLPADSFPMSWGAQASEFTGKIDDFGDLEKEQKRSIRKGIKVMCREIQMGVAAAQKALAKAGLKPGAYDVDRSGVVFGSDYILTTPDEFIDGVRGCLSETRRFDFNLWADQGLPRVTPLWLLKYLPNMPASHIAIYNDLRGPSNSLTMREASGNLAIGEAHQLIARGSADTIVAGATGTRVHPLRTVHVVLQEEVATQGNDPSRICRPFDLNRAGMVLGEGAGAVVLESLETAQRRGARILAEIVGSGSSAVMDGQGIGDCQAATRNVLRQTLETAHWTPDDVGHIHAHGLSTRRSDAAEAAAIAAVFGQRRRPVPVTAAKSYMGNPGAGGGVIELIASVLALEHGCLFPVLNFETPDPACPIEVIRSACDTPGDTFVNVNATPQGQASAVAVARFSAANSPAALA